MVRKTKVDTVKDAIKDTTKEVTDKIAKTTKEAVEIGQAVVEKNIKKIEDTTVSASKTVTKVASQKVKDISDSAKETVVKTSDVIANKVKSSISKDKDLLNSKQLYFEYLGEQVSEEALVEKFKLEWIKENQLKDINNIKVYYKIEENKAYFLVNDEITIAVDVF